MSATVAKTLSIAPNDVVVDRAASARLTLLILGLLVQINFATEVRSSRGKGTNERVHERKGGDAALLLLPRPSFPHTKFTTLQGVNGNEGHPSIVDQSYTPSLARICYALLVDPEGEW